MDQLQDEMKGVRQRKKQSEPIRCPVCSITVRPNEMEYHTSLEIERLQKIHNTGNRSKKIPTNSKDTPSCSSVSNAEPTDAKACWSTYQKIKNNRQARLKVKTRKRKADADGIHCPICNETTADDINAHVEICLRRAEGSNNSIGSDDESIDVEAESYDEYEWAGQTRIRASSLLEGGYSGTGLGTSVVNCSNADEDEDLNVDVDDTQIYGESQFSERDVIVPTAATNKETSENMYLRQLVVGEDLTRPDANTSRSKDDAVNGKWGESSESLKICVKNDAGEVTSIASDPCNANSNQQQIIESLKEKIREYEGQINNKCKCLICMDSYVDPVVSICCWHVHCEECWLRTLGARKLCPQCNMITSPTDLRRIYM
ncbi:E3 ubiquitin-protein ligase [Pseudolycoriella hygida]|uniref:E3 ubiquitin-protein ligase n=1 Tax=Pseudolycoriella hygida TaxID=35572 RepID=A0A9Q0MPX0_9DIPT|nr:E3 ubiquitin-protein ligase [Pseudolycoriella hygida]